MSHLSIQERNSCTSNIIVTFFKSATVARVTICVNIKYMGKFSHKEIHSNYKFIQFLKIGLSNRKLVMCQTGFELRIFSIRRQYTSKDPRSLSTKH